MKDGLRLIQDWHESISLLAVNIQGHQHGNFCTIYCRSMKDGLRLIQDWFLDSLFDELTFNRPELAVI